ncbi:MAG TPA: arginine deiminase-related protein [Bacteroidia bacterium]|nr:arginine deiminase-related protein [Bacteroidia bacterium]
MQATNHILLVQPAHFTFNLETAGSNAFQSELKESQESVKQKVVLEFEKFASVLESKGVDITVVKDTPFPLKPDAVFPNNWISFHENGTIILYPMFAPNRRLERREDIIESIKKNFVVSTILDLSKYEQQNKFLEGTGSIVFDHVNKIAYACLSPRTDKDIFQSAAGSECAAGLNG